MSNWPSDKVRKAFLDFFVEKHGHTFVPSSPVVPNNDPTLQFANSGMNQFKPIFLGQVDPSSEQATLKRAANSQKCIRAGGKHNDLEDVGKDTYHHTFFEMLGNWSFGDYFQVDAIDMAWELLTGVYGLDPKRLYATYFEGDAKENLEADTEALRLWGRYLPADHILKGNKKDNFWEMGATGPCGPCSELHYDRIGGRNCADLVNKDDPMVIEIWNLVFMQYNREADGKLKKLPRRHVDTGMGFERLTSILQDKPSNYDTDIFTVIFDEIQRITGAAPYAGKLGVEDVGKRDMAYRVVADHIRTLTFAISDGSAPGPTDRGYVLRRILKRAIRYGREFLGGKPGFFAQLVPVVVKKMGDFFPKLLETQDKVIEAIKLEEDRFDKSLEKGIAKFHSLTANMQPGQQISGRDVYVLYNAFGFPDDLTRLMAEERGLTIDHEGFVATMDKKREESRISLLNKAVAGDLVLTTDAAAKLKDALKVALTDDSSKFTLGEIDAQVLAIWTGKEFVDAFKSTKVKNEETGEEKEVGAALILNRTNFYAESGGQAADRGTVTFANGVVFTVLDVQSFGGYVAHIGQVNVEDSTVDVSTTGFSVGSSARLEVDIDLRRPTMANHTATHLVNHALREVLGDSCEQQGSSVSDKKLRFDYSYTKNVSSEQLAKIDSLVCAMISKELPIFTGEVPLDVAKSINGLRAMFGEKYPNPVRVVSVGVPISELVAAPYEAKWRAFPVELCGGTHLSNSREAKDFTVIEEGTHATGVHRLVAVTGEEALNAIRTADSLERRLQELVVLADRSRLNIHVNEFIFELENAVIPASRRGSMRDVLEKLKDEAQKLVIAQQKEAQRTAGDYAGIALEKVKAAGVHFWVDTLEVGGNTEQLSKAAKGLLEAATAANVPLAVLLLSKDEANPKKLRTIVTTAVAPELTAKLNASDWAKHASAVLGGKGGGKPEVAQGQGPDVSKTSDAAVAAAEFAKLKL
jgi:alanyl-tRNA synthetase